ncbi:mono-functional DNA-alkylating methyl methanesulfonate N-term-domain-containing protein [Tuber brumale]|nr:mono-functional DNA-alkylating methyl methanesulfonate N-term-domain-containing protein [Tuber brumale]
MSYLATIYEASSVRIAIKAEFLTEGETSLIVAKPSHIEVYKLDGPGIVLQVKFPIYGRVVALAAFRPVKSATDHLLIVIGKVNYQYFTVSWDPVAKKPKTEHTAVNFSEYHAPLSDSFQCLADPGKNMLGIHVYKGIFLVIPQIQQSIKGARRSRADLDIGNIGDPCVVRLRELEILDLKFLFGTILPVLAVLYKPSGADEMAVNTYELSVKSGEVRLSDWRIQDMKGGQEALFLIPVQPPSNGLLVIGVTKIQYFDNYGNKTFLPVDPPRVWMTWEMLSPERYILGDEAGGLHLLMLPANPAAMKVGLKLNQIGNASIPEVLVRLNQGLLFLGSHSGDSQVLQLHKHGVGMVVRVQQVLRNIGPMVDFRVMDLDYSRSAEVTRQYSPGHIRFLSASGGHKQGHLRTIRSGVGLDDLGFLGEMSGIRGLWSLRSIPESSFDDVLVVSFIEETRIFKFDNSGEIEELYEFMGFALDRRTILAHSVIGGRFLQVTSTAVKLVDIRSGTLIAESYPDKSFTITMASANQDLLIYAMGPTLVLLDLSRNLEEHIRTTFENEISCLNMPISPSKICAVGFWTVSLVLILSVQSFSILSQEILSQEDSAASPRSLLFARLLENGPPTFLVSLGDGSIFTFALNETTCGLSERKHIILGTQPIRFQPILGENGKVTVFATCDHPSVIYGSDERIVYASVTADNSTYVTSFNSPSFPDAVVIASEHDLKLSVVDPVRTMHVQSLPVGDVVRRIVYSKERNIIAIVTVSKVPDPRTGDDLHTSYIRLIDNTIFSVVDSYELNELELVESLASGKVCGGNGLLSEGFLAGTVYPGGGRDESEKGRIIVFNASETKRIKFIASYDTPGSVNGIQVVGDGKFVAAIGREVQLYSLEYSDIQSKTAASGSVGTTGCTITKLASFKAHSIPLDIAAYGDVIAVCDFMHGPSILQQIENKENKSTEFVEVARAPKPSWLTALELLDEKTVFCADTDSNLVVWQRQLSGVTEDDRRQLRQIASMKVGENVDRIRRISDQTLAGSKVQPKAHLSTVDGSMLLYGDIQAAEIDLLINLQTNLANAVKGLGGLDFLAYRAMSTLPDNSSTEPMRFVDGNFIETFLELPGDVARAVVQGNGKEIDSLGVSVRDVVDILEALKRLR